MFERAAILTFYAETPLHPGTGSTTGVVDLPIQRERHTQLPMVQASAVKGVLRDEVRQRAGEAERARRLVTLAFGPEPGERASDHAGALAFTDARLLLFPVRSLLGVFAWVTCPLILARYRRDLAAAGEQPDWDMPPAPAPDGALVPPGSAVASAQNEVTLEEYTYPSRPEGALEGLVRHLQTRLFPEGQEYEPFRRRLTTNLVLLPDDHCQDFASTATEVLARIRINHETGTVAEGALWYEEQLPTETVLYGLAMASPPRGEVVAREEDGLSGATAGDMLDVLARRFLPERIRLGGDETTGRGVVRLRVRPVGAASGAEAQGGSR